MPSLDEAIEAIRMGDREQGRQILEEILETEESNEEVWLWLSSVVDTDEDREICLENVLALDPNNGVAQKGLEALRSGTFNVHTILGEALDQREEQGESTFIDEFELGLDDFNEDDDLVMPSTMASSAPAKKKSKGAGINMRVILLIGLVLLVVLLAAGGLVASMFLGGDDGSTGPVDGQSQEVPSASEEPPVAEPAASDTPTPLPTNTPPPTLTPFTLPTSPPTPEPTPTATPVVPPTPG